MTSLNQVLNDCEIRIEEQNFIIDALKTRIAEQESEKKNEELFGRIKNRYEEIYFDEKDK